MNDTAQLSIEMNPFTAKNLILQSIRICISPT